MIYNLFKIYFWNFLSIVTNFLSVFIVTPYLAENKSLYGIYTLVSSFYLFFSYADFGFIGAAQKYAAEEYIKNNQAEETKVIGFGGFILFLFLSAYSFFLLTVSFNPSIILNNLSETKSITTARNLLIILSLSSPIFVLQRVIQIIFSIRLKDYMFQRALILANLCKITFVIFIFNDKSYPIVLYFLLSQLCNLGGILYGLYSIKINFNYNLKELFCSFKFTKELYLKTKNLAFVSIFLVICWVLYYEMDAFYISKYFGATELAGYALGLTIASYLRAVYGIVFSPFSAKFNHFIGMNEHKELHKYFEKVALYTLPLTVFPVMILFFSTKSFVFSWVGEDYADSVNIAKLLILGLMGGFITYPVGLLLMAYQKSKILFWANSILPIIFWAGVFIGVPKIGVTAIAFSKLIAFTTVFFIYLFISCKKFIDNTKLFLFSILKYSLIPGLSIYLISIFLTPYLPYSKSSINLLIYISYCFALFLFASFVFVVLSKELRTIIWAKLHSVNNLNNK